VFIQIGESDMKKKEEPRVAQRNFVAKYALENGGGWHRDRKKEYRRQPTNQITNTTRQICTGGVWTTGKYSLTFREPT
jgi:hypothetical protein